MGIKIKNILIGILSIAVGSITSCGNLYCPQMGNASEQKLDITLLNRQDTLTLGDSLIFQSQNPMLPFYFNGVTWDENATIIYNVSCGRLNIPNTDSTQTLMNFLTYEASPYDYNTTGVNTKYFQKTLGNNEHLNFGFVPTDTGNFWVSFYIPWGITFSDKQVPDYKKQCERNLDFSGNFSNLGQQPFMEHHQLPYREYLCTGNSCDTIVYIYGFRVEP